MYYSIDQKIKQQQQQPLGPPMLAAICPSNPERQAVTDMM